MTSYRMLLIAATTVVYMTGYPVRGEDTRDRKDYADSVVSALSQASQITMVIEKETRYRYRKELIERIPDILDTNTTLQPPLWVEELVVTYLNDTSRAVIRAAVGVAGKFRLSGIVSQLVETHRTSRQRFGGWYHGVEPVVVYALGRIGGNEAFELLSELLDKHRNELDVRDAVISAIADTKDPAFVPVLDAFIEKELADIETLRKKAEHPGDAPKHLMLALDHAVNVRDYLKKEGGAE